MSLIIRDGQLVGEIAHEIARLESLVSDLEMLGSGTMPSAAVLASAPLLDHYSRARRAVPCLIGSCSTHPRLNGPNIVTTDLWVMAEEQGWARTLGRFYRLGNPLSDRGR